MPFTLERLLPNAKRCPNSGRRRGWGRGAARPAIFSPAPSQGGRPGARAVPLSFSQSRDVSREGRGGLFLLLSSLRRPAGPVYPVRAADADGAAAFIRAPDRVLWGCC